MLQSRPLWEQPVLRQVAGDTLRPGGFTLTDRGAQLAGVLPGWRVLDVGCGLGATVARLRARFGADAVGVDMSFEQLAQAANANNLLQARGDRLPFCNGSFQAVFAECVLSLFDDPQVALTQWHDVLDANGKLIVTDLCGDGTPHPGVPSCAGGSVPVAATRAMVEQAGFCIETLEDHTDKLKELAAKLIFQGAGAACGCRGTGYYLLIAHKKG